MTRTLTTAGATAAVLALGGVVCPASAQLRFQYELVDVGTLGGENSKAIAINDQGVVVGWSETCPPECRTEAFVWQNGVIAPLGTLGGAWSQAVSVNSLGQIVGMSETASGEVHAFIAFEGKIRDLNEALEFDQGPDLSTKKGAAARAAYVPFVVLSEANDISEDGRIVGCGFVKGDSYPHAYLMTPTSADPASMEYKCERTWASCRACRAALRTAATLSTRSSV